LHMADVTKNFWGGHAIVGATCHWPSGLALGDKYAGRDGVTICMFGEGATNIGFFHEALNLSKVWTLPVLWVCENNRYGMGTMLRAPRQFLKSSRRLKDMAWSMNGWTGMNVLAVYEAGKKPSRLSAAGQGRACLKS